MDSQNSNTLKLIAPIWSFQQNNQLLIKVQANDSLYCGMIQPHSLITFGKIKNAIMTNNFQLVSLSTQSLQINIGGLLDIQMKGQQNATLESLQDVIGKLTVRVEKLTVRVEKESEKNTELEEKLKTMQTTINQIQHTNNQLKILLQNSTQQQNQQIAQLSAQLQELKQKLEQQTNQPVPQKLIQKSEIFRDSDVISEVHQQMTIRKFFQTKTIKRAQLLYKASNNDFSISMFHKKCDGIPSTLIVILTEFGRKIGGFTPLKWAKDAQLTRYSDNSKESFIFSLTHNDKFALMYPGYAIKNCDCFGPIFGDGYDLYVCNDANKNRQSSAKIGDTYNNEKYKFEDKEAWEKFHGDPKGEKYFKVKEWEVWALEWFC